MADEVVHPVPPDLDGERIDKALAVILRVSRSVARDLIDGGATVDGRTVKPADRVAAGSMISSPPPPGPIRLEPEPVEFGVLYEDAHLAIIDKPPGIVVHPGPGGQRGTLAAGLLHRYPELEGVGEVGRWGLVHRLDKETSGALVVGLTSESHDALREMIGRREVERLYTALVDGIIGAPTGTIDSPIGPDPTRPMRRAVARGGKPAVTHYEVTARYEEHDCSLLEVRLETGRTHQIRVHLAAIGHAVIGDRAYGTKTTRAKAPRLFLHASRLVLRHPVTGLRLEITAPLPADLQQALERLSAG